MSHEREKKVSIILSTFNEELAIEKTIFEIQKHIKNVEIIVVNDNPSIKKIDELVKKGNKASYKLALDKIINLAL